MKLANLSPQFYGRALDERTRLKTAITDFVDGIRHGNGELVAEAFDRLQFLPNGLKRAFREVTKLDHVPAPSRRRLVAMWVSLSDSLQSQVSDDRVLMAGLRAILPCYKGPSITLYRAETAWNRSRRIYGMSWTSSAKFAENQAQMIITNTSGGGSVVIKSEVSTDGILCAVAVHGRDRFRGKDYLVDRCKLGAVQVTKRFIW